MWPFAHAAIGYLLYSGYARVRLGRSPSDLTVFLVLLGTQTPDLVDKPLALLGVLPSGRALGHSLLFALPLAALVGSVVYRVRGDSAAALAFGLGHVSAALGDGAQQFIQGSVTTDIVEVSFWVWPLEVPAERIVATLETWPTLAVFIARKPEWTAAHLASGPELQLWIRSFEVTVTLFAVAVWFLDGRPGWDRVRALLGRR